MKKLTYLAINQYGEQILIDSKHPRKFLINYFGNTNIKKIYRDGENGCPVHIGYVINNQWFRLYKLEEFHGKINN